MPAPVTSAAIIALSKAVEAVFNYLTALLKVDPDLALAGHRRVERILTKIENFFSGGNTEEDGS
jgi:hypothetical protein